jgi:predicted aconitase
MKLNEQERAMQAGEMGPARQWAIEQQIAVGNFFDAEDLVEVNQVHMMADTESLGESGVEFLEKFAALPWEERRCLIPTVTDPRGIDLESYKSLNQEEVFAERERRAITAFKSLGVMMTDTCINYQIIMPPVMGEHLAFGDTGSVIYTNGALGARSNFEGGPAALAAALTGRVPRYGYHLDEKRRGTRLFEVAFEPQTLSDWGALGGVVGRHLESYWEVPVLEGITARPNSDELKHFGAALASYGSVALYHIVGVTPEAPDTKTVFDGALPKPEPITADNVAAFYKSFGVHEDKVDVVVFAAPQLSLIETQLLARTIEGKQIHKDTSLIATLPPAVKADADRMGYTATIEAAGGTVLQGVCFYQMYARETGEANGWKRLLSNSAKLVNIIQGYGYEPVLASMDACVDAAVKGRMGS